MENRDKSDLPSNQENEKWSDLPKNINFMNETSSINLCKLVVALARKYQAEDSGIITESSSTMSNRHPMVAAQLNGLKRENYKTDELIIKTEFSETENEATSAEVNKSSIVQPVDLQNMSKLTIKTEVLDTTGVLLLNSQSAEDPKIKSELHTQVLVTNYEPPPIWNFAENKDGLTFLPYQQIPSVVPVKEKKRPMTAAERARNMRARKRLLKVKKRPMTASERVKKCRELKKAAKKAIPFEVIAVNSDSSNFAAPDPAYYAQQYLSLNHEGHTFGNQFLNPFSANAISPDTNLVDGLVTEIKCEPSIDLYILEDNEKPLEICTELFCEPIMEANTESPQQQPLFDVEDYNAKRMRTERTSKYGALKKAMATAVPFERVGFNAPETPNNLTETEIADNVPYNSFQDRLWMFQDPNLKPTAMTAAERMRRYRQRKKEEKQKNKTLEGNFNPVDSI